MSCLTKTKLTILIYEQSINLCYAAEECLTSQSIVSERIRKRLGLDPITDYQKIPERLEPYVRAYWELSYRFLQEEKVLLEKMIDDLFADEGEAGLKEAQRTLDYLERKLEQMRAIADFVELVPNI